MPALKLDEDNDTLALPPETPDDPNADKVGIMDYGKAAASGVPGLGASVASGLQYLTGAGEDSYLAQARRASERGQKYVTESMSPGAQKALSANIMPTEGAGNDIWDRGASGAAAAVGLKAAASLPSLLATLIPGTLVARLGLAGAAAAGATEAGAAAFGASAGTSAAGAAAGLMSGGDVFQAIQNDILETPDAKLQDENDVYAGLRDMGLSEDDAKQRVINRAAGYKPLYMAAITAMTSKLGSSAESLLAGRAVGKVTGKAGVLAKGSQAAKTAGTEAGSEFVEESSGQLMQQQGAAQAKGADFQADWHAAIEAGLQGAVSAVPGGAASGAVGHHGGTHPDSKTGDPGIDQAADADPYQPHPEGTPADIPIDIAHVRPNNRAKPVVDTSTATSPEQMDAAAGTSAANAPTSVNEQATADLKQVDTNLARMEEDAKAANSVVQPAVPGASAPVPGVREAAATAAATPVPVVTPAGKVDPEVAAAISPRPAHDPELGEDPDEEFTPPPLPAGKPVVTPEVQRIITNPPAQANSASEISGAMGNMGAGISDGMYDMMWGQVEKGATTEAGQESAILQAAKLARANGGNLTRENFPQFAKDVANIQANNKGPAFQQAMRDYLTRFVANPSASDTLPPAAPDVAAPPPSEVAPDPVAGAAAPVVTPEVTTPPPSEEPIPLSPRADQRRVLRDVNEPAPVVEAPPVPVEPAKPRVSKGDALRAAQGDTAAVSTLTTNPDEFGDHNDRRKVWRAVDAMAKAGEITDPDWAEIASLRGKLGGAGGKPNVERFKQIRQRIADKVATVAAPEAATPQAAPVTKAEQRAEVRTAEKNEAAQKQAESARAVVTGSEYSADVRKGKPEALRQYINNLITKARGNGVRIPSQVREDTDPFVALLAHAKGVVKSQNPTDLIDFMALDFAVRNGEANAVREYRQAQAAKGEATLDTERDSGEKYDKKTGAPEGLVNEQLTITVDEGVESGTDRSEIYDREEAPAEALSEDAELVEGGTGAAQAEEVHAEPVARERPKVALAEGEGYTAPVARGRAVVQEVRRKRVVTPPAPKPGTSAANPAVIEKPADLTAATAHLTTPTPAQAVAENYPKAHVMVTGLPVTIETPKGGLRKGVGPDGKPWSVKLKNAYGYIKRSLGADGDQVDVYVGDDPKSPFVHVIDQHNLDGSFDEHKVVLATRIKSDATAIYDAGFSDGSGPQRRGNVVMMPRSQFKNWLASGDTTKPAARTTVTPEVTTAPKSNADAQDALQQQVVADNMDVLDDTTPKMARIDEGDLAASGGMTAAGDFETSLNALMRNDDMSRPMKGDEKAQYPGLRAAIMNTTAKRILRLAGDVKVRIVSQSRMMELYADEMIRTGKTGIPSGFYDPNTDEIVLREDKLDDPDEASALVLHEAVHAAFAAAMERRPNLKRFVKGLLETSRDRWDKLHPNEAHPYGFTDEHEFLAEALSNRHFMEFLNSTPVRAGDIQRARSLAPGAETVWTKLVNKIKDTLGLLRSDSALDYLIRAVHQLDGGRQRELTLRGNKLGRFDAVSDVAGAVSLHSKIMGYKVATFSQIEQRARGLFPTAKGEAITRVLAAFQKVEKASSNFAEAGHKVAAGFLDIRKRDPKEAQKMAEVVIDLTTSNLNVVDGPADTARLLAANPHLGKDAARDYQAKARLPELQKQFMALKPESRRYIMESAKYFRDNQNAIIRQDVSNVLDLVDTPLTDAQRSDLTNKAVNGLLDENDAKLINSEIVFKVLRDTAAFRLVDGIYFPLMRQGNFVVRSKDRITDTFGGKVVGDVVEFSGDEKTARAAYKQFAEKTKLRVTGVGKQRRLPGGQIVSAVDAAGHPHEVVYRARVMAQGLHMFDSASEAQRFIRQNKSTFHEIDAKPLTRAQAEQGGGMTHRQLATLMASAESRTGMDKAAKDQLRSTILQASVRMMAGNRIEHRSMIRRGVSGASEDLARSTIQYADASARARARGMFMPEVREALADARKVIKDSPYADEQNQDRNVVLKEVEDRVKLGDPNIDRTPQIVRDVVTLSTLDKLASPAYSMINGMQPWMVSLPVLGGRFGNFQAALHMRRAYSAIGGWGVTKKGLANTGRAIGSATEATINSADIVGHVRKSLAKQPDAQNLVSMFDQLNDRNLFSGQSGMEIAAAVAQGRGKVRTGLAKADRIARQLPIAVEVMNHATTAVAAYRLARASGMEHDAAVTFAHDTALNTQGDYSPMNTPGFFKHPLLRPALQFKNYAQMMSYLMVDMVQRGFGPSTPRAERVVALKQMANVIGVQVAMAGVLGLPGIELLKIGVMVAGALGLTDDDWGDEERRARKLADEVVGKEWGDLITRGVISRFAGVDLSTRMGLNDMWTFGEPKDSSRDSQMAYIGSLTIGAPGSLAADWVGAIKDIGNGDVAKGVTNLIPVKFMSDFGKAVRGRMDPDVSQPMTRADAVMQAVGFRSRRLAEEGEQTGQKVSASQDREAERKRLQDAYLKARTRGEQTKLKAEIKAHNDAPGTTLRQKVFPGALDKIRAERDKKRAELVGD